MAKEHGPKKHESKNPSQQPKHQHHAGPQPTVAKTHQIQKQQQQQNLNKNPHQQHSAHESHHNPNQPEQKHHSKNVHPKKK